MDPFSIAIGAAGASIIFGIIHKFLGSSNAPSELPREKTEEELRIEQNRLRNSSLYRLQDLIIDINNKRDTGIVVDLNFYPRTNYLFNVRYIGGKKLLEIIGSCRTFHNSSTIFREHIMAYGVSDICFVELTKRQQEMLKLKIANKDKTTKTEHNVIESDKSSEETKTQETQVDSGDTN
jgi:hypothetical protein